MSALALAPNDFVHLHTHSEFSLLDGLGRITDLVDEASAKGMDSLALTDHGALYGSVAFYQAARNKGIKPIVGVETYIARRSMTDKEGKADAQPFHLVLLATNATGYRNLCRLVTDAHIDGYYYKPRIDREHLARYSDGLIGLSACLNGEVSRALEVEDWDLARAVAGSYSEIFGKGRFFLELQDHGLAEQRRLNEQLLRLAPELDLPLVVTNDLHYVRREQHEAHDVLLCVGTASNLDTPGRLKFETDDFFLKSAAEMAAKFPDHLDAILNTKRIAEMCDLELTLGQTRIPVFPVPDGESVESWLRKECQRGLAWRYGTVTEELQARLDYELGVITSMGYAGYFLIVADFIRFAREQGIQTTCRGSAPGSIVTYTLGITPVDPIAYGLPFERFLNPDRVTMPDIDVDFQDDRRDEVIAYVSRKYGQDHVAQIITFGTMLARAAIRDVGRVLGHSYGEVDRIAKAVPNQLGIKLDEALETAPQLREQYEGESGVKRIIDFARQLEGVSRNASTHAAGVVISDEPLTEIMPLQKATNSDSLMTQYEMHAIEALGLLKFDFLGLSNLTILKNAVDLIRAHRGIEIDLDNIPLDDAHTFELLSTGETTGVFQLESAGMRRYVRELRPTSVFDLAAMVALYRPGPMDNIDTYVNRKHGREQIDSLHPMIEPILEETYGVIIYQEQVMQIAQVLSNFSLAQADHLRKAMGKKIKAEMDAQRKRFVEGAVENGVDRSRAEYIFELVAKFAGYGFNKSHAAAYALIAYQTAYLKANHTTEFIAASMTLDMGNADKLNGFAQEARRLGIRIEPPSINHSEVGFLPSDQAIRYSLAALKNVGRHAVEHLCAERAAGGPFRDLGDFSRRINPRYLNKRALETFAAAGALDDLGIDRATAHANVDRMIAAGNRSQEASTEGQEDLFSGETSPAAAIEFRSAKPWLPIDRLSHEFEAVGFFLTGHPLDDYKDVLEALGAETWAEFAAKARVRRVVGVLAGTVLSARERKGKTGNPYAFAAFSEPTGQFEAVLFSEVLSASRELLVPGTPVLLDVEAEADGETVKVRVQRLSSLEKAAEGRQAGMKIYVDDPRALPSLAEQMGPKGGKGQLRLVVRLDGLDREVEFVLPKGIDATPKQRGALQMVEGVAAIRAL